MFDVGNADDVRLETVMPRGPRIQEAIAPFIILKRVINGVKSGTDI